MLFSTLAYAAEAAATQPAPSVFSSLAPLLVVFAVFYFLIIRPQSKKYNDQKNMVSNSKVGDEVVILSGVFGKISSIDEKQDTCEVEIASGTSIKLYKSGIVSNITLTERNKAASVTVKSKK